MIKVSFVFKLFLGKVFEQVRGSLDKLAAVSGDVTLPGLGISSQETEMLVKEVSIAFHSAATIRFDEDLKTALTMNVKGPKHMLDLCRQMKHLRVKYINCFFIHY